jgi:hypothetical protein
VSSHVGLVVGAEGFSVAFTDLNSGNAWISHLQHPTNASLSIDAPPTTSSPLKMTLLPRVFRSIPQARVECEITLLGSSLSIEINLGFFVARMCAFASLCLQNLRRNPLSKSCDGRLQTAGRNHTLKQGLSLERTRIFLM